MTNKEKLGMLQEFMSDLKDITDEIFGHINCAESCEEINDFFENIDSALKATNELEKELKRVLKKDKGV
jgi:hypothetical protein